MDRTEKLLKELTEAPGVSGYESEIRKIMRRHLEPVATIEQDRMGSIIGVQRGTQDNPRIMLAGHMDEVGFMVKLITKEGFIKFVTLGGWWDQVVLAQRVTVLTRNGEVPGVIGAKPPHLLQPEERKKVLPLQDMYVDVGATSREEVEALGVRPGDPMIPICPFTIMSTSQTYMAKAWDDRVGCALAIQALEQLAATDHPNTVYGVGTVQEEVGLRGARTTAHAISPDVGIILEVGIAGDVPGIKAEESAVKLGGGPVLLVFDASMIPNLGLRNLAIDTAKELNINLQFDAMQRGGTDGGAIHLHAEGVPSIVLGVASRHIHSHASIIHRQDYDDALRLTVELVKRLDAETVAGLTR
ncbi:MAG: M42 family metallopeptidase [Chloroflexota bacterium]